jgi:hypothetical protein
MINTSLFGLSQKNRDKLSSVKEQAFNFMWDGIIIHFIGYLSAKYLPLFSN